MTNSHHTLVVFVCLFVVCLLSLTLSTQTRPGTEPDSTIFSNHCRILILLAGMITETGEGLKREEPVICTHTLAHTNTHTPHFRFTAAGGGSGGQEVHSGDKHRHTKQHAAFLSQTKFKIYIYKIIIIKIELKLKNISNSNSMSVCWGGGYLLFPLLRLSVQQTHKLSSSEGSRSEVSGGPGGWSLSHRSQSQSQSAACWLSVSVAVCGGERL